MSSASLQEIVSYCDRRLRPDTFADYDRAWNGLQVENQGKVTRIIAAVDASRATVELALRAKGDLMIVHHGLFWSPTQPWTGSRYGLMKRLLEGNLAVYSQHLPLDGHPTLGNAAQLARALGFRSLRPFFAHKGAFLGVQTRLTKPISREKLGQELARVLGKPPVLLPGGALVCRRLGICTGGAGSELSKAVAEGVDTFITGEGPHWTHALAEDQQLNVFYGGHYATETFGVKALAAEVAKKFALPWEFLDHPSGL